MKKKIGRLLMISALIISTTACADMFNPTHAFYVESGQKAKDRKKYEAAILTCLIIFKPQIDRCTNGGTVGSCTSQDFYIIDVGIPTCAEAMAGVPRGEFYKHGM